MLNRTPFAVVIVYVTLFFAPSYGQKKTRSRVIPTPLTSPAPIVDQLAAARDATETFLKGAKLIDLPEGKEMLQGVQWITDASNSTVETLRFTEATTQFEKLFDTDTPGIQGYKRLLDMKAVSEASTPLFVQYIIIAYKDQRTKRWKVLGAGKTVDIEDQVAYFAGQLHNPYLSAQDSLLVYGGWLLQAGRIKEARQTLISALHASTTSTGMFNGRPIDNGKYAGLFHSRIEALLNVMALQTWRPLLPTILVPTLKIKPLL